MIFGAVWIKLDSKKQFQLRVNPTLKPCSKPLLENVKKNGFFYDLPNRPSVCQLYTSP